MTSITGGAYEVTNFATVLDDLSSLGARQGTTIIRIGLGDPDAIAFGCLLADVMLALADRPG